MKKKPLWGEVMAPLRTLVAKINVATKDGAGCWRCWESLESSGAK